MAKEIHFYESFKVCPVTKNIHLDWKSSKKAIDDNVEDIHTIQMCLLSNTLLLKGYRMFIHQDNGITYEITLKSRGGGKGDHAVRDAQNVYAMWASNVFRIPSLVDDYIEATKDWNVEGLKYEINGVVYANIDDIPCDVKNKIVESYKYHADDVLIFIETVKELCNEKNN